MKQTFDPSDPAALEAALADLASDEVALDLAFRSRLLDDAARVNRPQRKNPMEKLFELLGFAGLPAAALAGAWFGVLNPTLIDQVSPWAISVEETEDALLDDVFGAGWVSLEDTE